MPRLLQHFLAPIGRLVHAAPDSPTAVRDEDIPLGCESADPSLQFDTWEPLPAPGPAPLVLSSNL
jgi:hypothetical protein